MSELDSMWLRRSAGELARLYRQGELSPVEVTRALLERSAQRQTDLNTFAAIDASANRGEGPDRRAGPGHATRFAGHRTRQARNAGCAVDRALTPSGRGAVRQDDDA